MASALVIDVNGEGRLSRLARRSEMHEKIVAQKKGRKTEKKVSTPMGIGS